MTVKEYASVYGVSVQSVYQRLKTGSLESEEVDGVKHIVGVKAPSKGNSKGDCKELVKVYKGTIKQLRKDIKALKKDHRKSYGQLEKLFDKLLAVNTPVLPEIIEGVIVKKKKKKGH